MLGFVGNRQVVACLLTEKDKTGQTKDMDMPVAKFEREQATLTTPMGFDVWPSCLVTRMPCKPCACHLQMMYRQNLGLMVRSYIFYARSTFFNPR
jgi:hypothetical protein